MATSTEFSKPLNQDISEKADKVLSATNGHFAGLDSNGNLTDSGKSATDFVGAPSFYATEMPMSSSDSTKVSEAIENLTPTVISLTKTTGGSTYAGHIYIPFSELNNPRVFIPFSRCNSANEYHLTWRIFNNNYFIIVTDASGTPVANTEVSFNAYVIP